MCQPLNAWDIEIEELLTFFDDFNIISSKQFREKRLFVKSRDDKSDLVRGAPPNHKVGSEYIC